MRATFVLLMLLALTGCVSHPTAEDRQNISILGTVQSVSTWPTLYDSMTVYSTYPDPRFLVRVAVDESQTPGFAKDQIVGFAIHSISKTFAVVSTNEVVGKQFHFHIRPDGLDRFFLDVAK